MAQATYITAAEMAESYDSRSIGELSSDDGRVGPIDATNTIVANAIERASADVESFVLRGGRHTLADLAALQTADDWTLKGLVATLAMAHLYRRRGRELPASLMDAHRAAMESLDELGSGKQVFADTGAIAAGKPSTLVVTENERTKLRMVSDEPYFRTRRIYN